MFNVGIKQFILANFNHSYLRSTDNYDYFINNIII